MGKPEDATPKHSTYTTVSQNTDSISFISSTNGTVWAAGCWLSGVSNGPNFSSVFGKQAFDQLNKQRAMPT